MINTRPRKSRNKANKQRESLLQKINHISQPLLLLVQIMLFILAYYGYVYTVRPVYTKALLEEDIAKKQLLISELDSKISEYKINESYYLIKIKSATDDIRAKSNIINDLNIDIDNKNKIYNETTAKLKSTEREIDSINIYYNQSKNELKKTYTNLLHSTLEHIKISSLLSCNLSTLKDENTLSLPSICIGNTAISNIKSNSSLSRLSEGSIDNIIYTTLNKYDLAIPPLQSSLNQVNNLFKEQELSINKKANLSKFDKANAIVSIRQNKHNSETSIHASYRKTIDSAIDELSKNLTLYASTLISNDFYMTIAPDQ